MIRSRNCIALAALCSLAFSADARADSLSTTACHSITSDTATVNVLATAVTGVQIQLRTGTPPAHDGQRREHVRISAALATALGIAATQISATDESRQIRVVHGTSTANFTVAAIDAANTTTDTIEVWRPEDLNAGTGSFTDKDNGFFKVFGFQNPTTVFASAKTGTVYDNAPGTTVVINASNQATHQVHFTEPNAGTGKQFRECVELDGTGLAVLVPHGGNIETSISGQLSSFLSDLQAYGHNPSVWEGSGQWGDLQTFQRWHITSPQISGVSFPGFGMLEDQGNYDYAVALHGFTHSEAAVVFGGNSHRQVKCHLIEQIEDHLADSDLDGRITYRIYGPDGTPINVLRSDIADPQPLSGVDDLAGLDDDNIVNRISENPLAVRGQGGIQLEMSSTLRSNASLFAAFIEGLAIGIDQEIELDPNTDYCAQLLPPIP